jgi:hypothetical protein
MSRKETSRREFNRLATTVILGAVLAACTPMGQAQETRPNVTQSIDGLQASEEDLTSTATSTATPENTPTTTATATPESSPTPKAPEFPTNLEFILIQQTLVPLRTSEWGPYQTRDIHAIKIRPQDIHYEEFTLLNGRYLVRGWVDAWWQEREGSNEPGKMHHLALPYRVIDTETRHIYMLSSSDLGDLSEKSEDLYTAITEGWSIEQLMENDLEPTAGGDLKPYGDNIGLYFGHIPSQEIDSNDNNFLYIKEFLDFWEPLLKDIYTPEKIEEFARTGDASILSLEALSDNLPVNFVIPIKPEG